MRPTARMLEVLASAQHAPLRRTHAPGPGRPLWPAAAATLYALVRHGLLAPESTRNRHGWPVDTWMITEAGREVLHPPPRLAVERAQFLAHTVTEKGQLQPAYTADPRRAMRDEGGAVEAEGAELRVAFLMSPRAIGRHARELAAFAESAGLDDKLDALRRALADIDLDRRRSSDREAA